MANFSTYLATAEERGLVRLRAQGKYTMIARPDDTEDVAYAEPGGGWKLRSGETGHGWFALARALGLDLRDAAGCV